MFTTRPAETDDYDFFFQLRKISLYDLVQSIFGWDEHIQQRICHQEWQEARPTIIEVEGKKAGSYLVQIHADHIFLSRFYILPEFQGQGMGSLIIQNTISIADSKKLPIRLCYLKGNKVENLYERFGFQITSEDHEFVHMLKA